MIKVLAYRFSAFGDVAMLVPVFKEILEQNPELEITMVSRKNFEDLFVGIERLKFKGINLDDFKGITGLYSLANQLKSDIEFDVVADMHDVLRTNTLNWIFRWKGIQVFQIDKGKKDKKHLVNIWNVDKKPLRRTIERYAEVFRKIGCQVQLKNKLKPIVTEKSGIGLAPFAQHKGKVLPKENAFELAKILAGKHPVFFFGGGKAETEVLKSWEEQIPNSTSLAGKLSLKEELQKIASLEVMISMDSANMHLASLVGTRCISIWGQTHSYAGFLGYGQSEDDIVQVDDLTCRPCSVFGDKECFRSDWACLNELSVQHILDKL